MIILRSVKLTQSLFLRRHFTDEDAYRPLLIMLIAMIFDLTMSYHLEKLRW